MDGEQDNEDLAIKFLGRYSDELPNNVYRIYLSNTGELISTSTDPADDPNYWVHYPFSSEGNLPQGVSTITRDKLEELQRLGPDVDLVTYPNDSEEPKKVIFKYYFLWQYANKAWKEMNLWMRIPTHPHIVPFDRVVIDEVEARIVGFTNQYFPGGTLEENKRRKFRFEWLEQLIKVVDDLNFKYSIAHQDIAPRNIVVDDLTDNIKLFDFNFAARINCAEPEEEEYWHKDRDDVKGVIFTAYEIITRDQTLRDLPHKEQKIENMPTEWKQHPDVELNRSVEAYQKLLQDWREQRSTNVSPAEAIN
ncbi:hypothetical protein HJFPF1_10484 [Paramyrothecium foliicola]|nr:hypothetical protein HJFPF1_10484 [Paramyrothecium foliicola]